MVWTGKTLPLQEINIFQHLYSKQTVCTRILFHKPLHYMIHFHLQTTQPPSSPTVNLTHSSAPQISLLAQLVDKELSPAGSIQ